MALPKIRLMKTVPRIGTDYNYLKNKLLDNSYKWNLAHVPSALSMLRYLSDLIPLMLYKYPEYKWIAGKQFGQQAYYTIYQELGLDDLIPKDMSTNTNPLLLNTINKEFAYIEETLGNSLGVAIGMAMSQKRPIWVNLSDSVFQMGRTIESLKIIKKFNLNIFITVDSNGLTRAAEDKRLNNEIYNICNALGIDTYSTYSWYCNNFNIEFEKVLNKTEPRIMIITTKKGDGFYEFENNPIDWHYKKLTLDDYKRIKTDTKNNEVER